MAKTLLSVAAATGVAATAAPATFLSSSAGSGTGEGTGNIGHVEESKQPSTEAGKNVSPSPSVPSKPFTPPNWPAKLIPQLTSAEDIKNKHGDTKCLKEYFGKINWNEKTTDNIPSDLKEFSEGSRSCLTVEYYKQKYEGGNWWGELRLLWAVKDEANSQGLVTVINTRMHESKFKGNAAVYILKKDSSKESWTATYMKKTNEEEISTNEKLSNLILQGNNSLSESINHMNYWGFDPDITKVCKSNNCTKSDGNKNHKYYAWELVGNRNESGSLIYFWANSTYNWWQRYFRWEDLDNKMDKIKGTWGEKTDWLE